MKNAASIISQDFGPRGSWPQEELNGLIFDDLSEL